MNFYQLSAFVEVAEEKSFSKAAEKLFLSQSTVSAHINSLEKYFEQKVFDRMGRKIVLTPFGEKLYYWSNEILKTREKALWDLNDWTGKMDGKINIVASTVPGQYLAPTLMSNFFKIYKDTKFSLTQLSSEAVAEVLLSGDADLGMSGEQYYPDKLTYIPFYKEKLVLITPKEIVLEDPVHIYDLIEYEFIFRKPGSGTQSVLEKTFKKINLSPTKLQVVGYFDNVQSIKRAVMEGMGISIISEVAALDYWKYNLINLYHISEMDNYRSFYLVLNKQKTLTPILNVFIDFCKKEGKSVEKDIF